MQILIKKAWEYILYKDNQKYLLEVVCGGAAIFELKIILDHNEIESYLSDGQNYIDQLAEKIRKAPDQYIHRKAE
ncbi:hypothetical protein [uncultured Chryseobacterium sp.]|uniref:hypothetical protein n=1 Tax=uncultured Chryseobacterium sp. TaxID=259322 RepID=UPI0025E243CE|nr:hypothetical protein [uncultured Chryseobacterium sp.]